MATIVLSAAGAAVGGALGGSVMGLSAAVIGRAAGATLGQMIDQRLMGSGSEVIERGRIDRFRLTGAGEGAGLARLYGRTRMAGQVIWASNFLERRQTTRTGGKGAPSGPSVRSYSYSVSLAVALCEGEISHVGRVWADGAELSREDVTLRVYAGADDQLPDPKISAVEGSGNAPAYRGTAYVVFEDLDLARFGNRVPQFSFEVTRPDPAVLPDGAPSMTGGVQAVALVPGTGEYSLATTPVHYADGPGRNSTANVHSTDGQADFLTSLDALETELPGCGSVSLVVSWFGNDLRCGACALRPKVEHRDAEGVPMPWQVAGRDRMSAELVPRDGDRPVYGATPADASVVEAIRELRARGKSVVFYPFILMEQLAGNGRTDPWTGAADQPPLPWRGRITTSVAPGEPGSPDGTAAAEAEVAAFFGTASASDFSVGDGSVSYSGPSEWSLRRFILHYAALCAASGGVDAFCISSEMRALTQIRGAGHSFPAVNALCDLAAEVRQLVGPGTKIGYAADWSEYFGYTPEDGAGHRYFHLDPLWSDPQIDFIGIDNYMPLSDWRDGEAHADAGAGSIYDLDYLRGNIAGGEGFDWYYANDAGFATQDRLPITDGAHDEPWIYRYKDLVSWWSLPHHDRIGGVRQANPTAWVPGSKPIWFTELGCAAIDKGTNQPNKFLDPKSSESKLPRGSNGARDDLIQMQYLRAMFAHWSDPSNNPVSSVYGGPMVDMGRAHVWAWDARPYPWFPGLQEIWSDFGNYNRGHWLNGRTGSRHLASVVAEICDDAGLPDVNVARLHGLVRGYSVSQSGEPRRALEPLMTAFGFEALERDGQMVFRTRGGAADLALDAAQVARHPEAPADITRMRASEGEMAGRVRLNFVTADGSYEIGSAEADHPGGSDLSVAQSELDLVLTGGEAQAITERWLSETRVARESVRLALPPSRVAVGPGDVIALDGPGGEDRYRIDRVDQFDLHLVEAVRIEPGIYGRVAAPETSPRLVAGRAPLPPTLVFLDLPLMAGTETPHAPHLAVAADPWPGDVALLTSPAGSDYRLNTVIEQSAVMGVTETPLLAAMPGLPDRGPALRVQLASGALLSAGWDNLLEGANAMAIGDGSSGTWEVFQFAAAEPVAADTWELRDRLRGQVGTDAIMPPIWPVGSLVVLLDGALRQIDLAPSVRGLARHYLVGPADRPVGDPTFVHVVESFDGVGLRPYAPVHLRLRRSGGDHVFGWIRRTRLDGDIWSLPEVPLGETAEEYLLRVEADGDVLREERVTVASWTYTAAARASDGVTGTYTLAVAQVSDRFGPGIFRRIEIDDNDSQS